MPMSEPETEDDAARLARYASGKPTGIVLGLLGAHFQERGQIEAAALATNLALRLTDGPPDWLLTNGAALRIRTGDYHGALDLYRAALDRFPNSPHAPYVRIAHAETLMALGQLDEGWPEYESRWSVPGQLRKPDLPGPEWNGEDLNGGTLMVYAEQGLGDTLMFIRYLPLVRHAIDAHIVVVVPERLTRLLRFSPALIGITLIGKTERVSYDAHIPLLSLPYQTGVSCLPAERPYLMADPIRAAHWRERLGSHGRRIGICWRGNDSGTPDNFKPYGRSVPLASFAPLATLPGVRLISLQVGADPEEIRSAGFSVETFDGLDQDAAFHDSAAIMANLDAVVTIDTSIAHLAGAMQVPTHVALKKWPEWRWGLEGDTTPWYPTLRLVRQSTDGDWSGVFDTITKAFEELGLHRDRRSV